MAPGECFQTVLFCTLVAALCLEFAVDDGCRASKGIVVYRNNGEARLMSETRHGTLNLADQGR